MIACSSVITLAAGGPALAQEEPDGAASCRTFDDREQPSTLFTPGDEILVVSDDLEPYALGRVDLVQGERTRLTTVLADEEGRLTTGWRKATVPTGVAPGKATIEVSSAASSAACEIQILDAAPDTVAAVPAAEQQSSSYVTLWAVALLLFGSLLSALSLRKWRVARAGAVLGTDAFEADEVPAPEEPEEPLEDGEDEDADEQPTLGEFEDEDEGLPGKEEPEDAPVLQWGDLEDPDAHDAPDDEELVSAASSTVARLMRETRSWRVRRQALT